MIHTDPVGLPALIVLGIGLAAFVAALLAARRRARVAGAPVAGGARSRRSVIGIALQAAGLFAVAFGPVRPILTAGSAASILATLLTAALMAAVVALFAGAARALGRNWSLVARTLGDHALVETGPFAYVRHPIYTALALLMLAMAVAYGHVSYLILGAPLYALGTWLRVVEEERLLRAMFGPAYAAYAARVTRFVPALF